MEQSKSFSSGQGENGDTWYVDNYILLKNYYDMTISRIAARCVRSGNIAMEEYPHYAYILDVLEEISETGEYIIAHQNLYPYVEKKIAGGINALKANLKEYKTELEHNASPDMIKEDANELKKMKETLGEVDKKQDPTAGAGMSMDEVINKLMKEKQETEQPKNPSQSQQQAPHPQPKPHPTDSSTSGDQE